MATLRSVHGFCPQDVFTFILDLFKYNDNTKNKVLITCKLVHKLILVDLFITIENNSFSLVYIDSNIYWFFKTGYSETITIS